MSRTVVVGAGVTGLVLLHHLREAGMDAVLLEATDRVGGVVGSCFRDGQPLELGPQRGRLVPAFRELVEELGLAEELLRAPPGLPLLVYRSGRLRKVPFSARDAVTTDLLSTRGKLRVLAEPFRAGPRPDEAVGAYLRRAFGEEAYRALLGPLYGGLYASDPDRMIVRLSLARTLEELGVGRSLLAAFVRGARSGPPPPAVSFPEGLATLPRALARAHQGAIRLARPVRSLRPDGSRPDEGWTVVTDEEEIRAERVVLAIPAPEAAGVLTEAAPDAARALGALRYNPLALVHLRGREGLEAAGFQVAFGEETPLRGVTSHAALFGRAGLHTAFLGGMGREEVVDRPDAGLAEEAEGAFRRMTGLGAETVHVHRTWIPAWDHTWAALDRLEVPPGILLAGGWRSRPGLPGRLAEAQRLAGRIAGDGEEG